MQLLRSGVLHWPPAMEEADMLDEQLVFVTALIEVRVYD